MSDLRLLRLFFHAQLLQRAQAGNHNYTNRLRGAIESAGWRLELCLDSDAARMKSVVQPGYSLFHMAPPLGRRCLTTRLAYVYPFWRIEASAKRWEFDVARATFDPDTIDSDAARAFYQRRRQQHVPGIEPDGDAVFVPLQGRITEHRSFQTMSPLQMLKCTIAQTGSRPIIASLHPNETYSADDLAQLDAIASAHPRLTVTRKPMTEILPVTSLIVTQNSSVALHGYLLGLPAILFGQIDFHHIALNVSQLGVEGAFERVADYRPDYVRYYHWFLKDTAINAAVETAEDQIRAAFRRHGWPM